MGLYIQQSFLNTEYESPNKHSIMVIYTSKLHSIYNLTINTSPTVNHVSFLLVMILLFSTSGWPNIHCHIPITLRSKNCFLSFMNHFLKTRYRQVTSAPTTSVSGYLLLKLFVKCKGTI